MTNTFKLTKAEFLKIFKRPSVFIMAILLVVTILVSMSIFNPVNRIDYTITYDGASNSQEYYDNFYNDIMINSKATFDEGFATTDNVIKYYQAINNNTILLTDYYNNIVDTMRELSNETNTNIRDQIRYTLIKDFEAFSTAYNNLDALSDYPEMLKFTLEDVDYDVYTANFYKTDACIPLNQFSLYVNDTTKYSSSEIVNIYNTNNYELTLKSTLNNAINFISTTLLRYTTDFNFYYPRYLDAINNARSDMDNIKKYSSCLLKSLNAFYDYYTLLISSDYPTILVSDSTHQVILQKVEESISYLDMNVSDKENLVEHKTVKDNLDRIGISSFLKNLTSSSSNIKQVTISDVLITDLLKYQAKVTNNKSQILDNISNKLSETSTTGISKEITNYSLLEKSYSTLINEKVLSCITQDYDQNTYTNFHGYNFKDFNKYESSEKIALNSYYIDNNTYENSYLTNFSYNQNSGSKTNVYDFVYFAMELCTLIIIIFSMMLICNLITGETESGTIKLLLVRPYKRSKIITAKLLATIFFVMTFMAFSSIITCIGGYFIYGDTTLNVLAVFNAKSAFEISPFMLMIINIFTLTLDVIFFVLLALMISIICKNYAASISCSLVILIINFAFNILFGGTFWYTLLPGMNLHLFKYFGNSFTSILGGSSSFAGLMQTLLITGIDSSMTIWFSIIISSVYAIVFLAISYAIFKKRDF